MSTRGTHRELVSDQEARKLREAGVLIDDSRRERPRWFDGRFLAARDLIREQDYFLTREADLGRAAGSGVASGLQVARGARERTLRLAAGHGITPSGELVLLEQDLDVDLADLPREARLSVKFGLGQAATDPARSRNGLFVLCLRPVEYTANPTGAYPKTITGQRSQEDGDIIEATAAVLVPWPDDGEGASLTVRRARAARAIFVDGADTRMPANLVPLAMLGLDDNSPAWIDMPMVRRELGADRGDLPGLGLAPRALRLAHLLQYQQHLAQVVADYGGRGFPAATVFPALPPAGPLPPGVIDPNDFTQRWLPAGVDVEFSIIPDDELPALVEEALALPPFDLDGPPDDLAGSAVLVLAPVPRHDWNRVLATLDDTRRSLRPAAPNQIAARNPLEVLQRLRLPQPAIRPIEASTPSETEWRRLASQPGLWYVRRRNLAYREDLAGAAVRLAGRVERTAVDLTSRIATLGLTANFDAVIARATPAAALEINNLLASPRLEASPALTAVALGELARAETLDHAGALGVAGTLTRPEVGEGLVRMETATATAVKPEVLRTLAETPEWQVLDSRARVVEVETLPTLTARDLKNTTLTRPVLAEPVVARTTLAQPTISATTLGTTRVTPTR